jgi:2-keto-4-pentenoate hydratase/2-oxohepta-3-ene-1,7-dioic acid hydratase in catechol pathway
MANLISAGTWRQPIDEFIPIGPVTVKIKLAKDVQGKNLNLLVSGQKIPATVNDGWCRFKISSILNHELVVIS